MSYQVSRVHVDLGDRGYPIHIGRGLSNNIKDSIDHATQEKRRGAAIVDEGLLNAQPVFCQEVVGSLPLLSIPVGEGSKSTQELSKIWDFLAAAKIDRSGFIFALGGGVVGDLSGFAAASYLRGISFHHVPTTLLAMVDSSVGGKTGINLGAGKNLVGAFHQPQAVWADLDLLDSLPPREFSAGMAEVIKYGLLGDGDLFSKLLRRKEIITSRSQDLSEIVKRCCENKARIVQSDERETYEGAGGRALLNLGHTFAHAIEAVAGYGSYLHGEAVAVGLVCALRLSQSLGYCEDFAEEDLISLLQSYNLPVNLRTSLSLEKLQDALSSDKKVSHGVLRFVVMRKIGDAFCTDEVRAEGINQVWNSVGAI